MRNPLVLLALGPFVAFFGTGHFSGFGALTAELYPTTIRATAQGSATTPAAWRARPRRS